MKFLIGKKLEMTQMFVEDKVVPVTRIRVLQARVVDLRQEAKHGYSAVVVGAGKKRMRSKSQKSVAQNGVVPEVLKEFRVSPEELSAYQMGAEVPISTFEVGAKISVIGTSKGKGFAGVVKRHHFAGHPASHGHKDQLRTSGAIGAGGMQHVRKGQRMAGRMGNERTTVKGLKVMGVDAQNNVLTVSGAIPGARNSIVTIKSNE